MLTLAAETITTAPATQLSAAAWIPWLPALAAVVCAICAIRESTRVYAAWVCVAGIVASFVLSAVTVLGVDAGSHAQATSWEWISLGRFSVDFGWYIDPLTAVMLMVVTGVGALVAIYAAGYMQGERGYARFFAFVSLFIFAMLTLVMADNLVLLYLGWEGVGLCSYLLIGFDYHRPAAVAAAKKAFIVNRIGDFGFLVGIFAVYLVFGSVEYSAIIPAAQAYLGQIDASSLAGMEGAANALAQLNRTSSTHSEWLVAIPFLLMLGAFGKSAQLPLHVWLPDAMEGPTPVSALIHAATMVTAGVYMIARLIVLFDPQFSPAALPTVAVVGSATALFAATIACCQYDLKKVFAYSTMSQLGYMFVGVAAMATAGGVFHLFTHAFFKALLFLTAGSVMHALAGQLDMRKISGLRKKMPLTFGLMGVGCLALAGVPPLAGFWSKDAILVGAWNYGLETQSTLYIALGWIGFITAFITAYYTFRLFFRVFFGEERYEMGAHGAGPTAAADAHGGDAEHAHDHHAEPHEPVWWMNAALAVLAAGSILGGAAYYWVVPAVDGSTAATHVGHTAEHLILGINTHTLAIVLSFIVSLGGIAVAWFFHLHNRTAAESFGKKVSPLVTLLENKYYVDEIYDALIVKLLLLVANVTSVIDGLIVNNFFVETIAAGAPKLLGKMARPTQRGLLQGYGAAMVAGVAILALLVWFVTNN